MGLRLVSVLNRMSYRSHRHLRRRCSAGEVVRWFSLLYLPYGLIIQFSDCFGHCCCMRGTPLNLSLFDEVVRFAGETVFQGGMQRHAVIYAERPAGWRIGGDVYFFAAAARTEMHAALILIGNVEHAFF